MTAHRLSEKAWLAVLAASTAIIVMGVLVLVPRARSARADQRLCYDIGATRMVYRYDDAGGVDRVGCVTVTHGTERVQWLTDADRAAPQERRR